VEPALQPRGLDEALALRAGHPEAVPIAGGTDLMVALNFGHARPERLLDLGGVRELEGWAVEDGVLRIGAGVTHARLCAELTGAAPGLALAARTVGSPQIRNRGTLGGNLATASPAGDALPPLVAADAEVELASARGRRRVPVAAFATAPKRSVLEPDELVVEVRVPAAPGPQQFAKVGTRNAMVISVCSLALALDPVRRRVGVALGSAAPTVVRARAAEEYLAGSLDERGLWDAPAPLPQDLRDRYAGLVADAARPIDDVRGSAAYRRHALAVLARRTLDWAWDDLVEAG
jgi:CO/xanthine dehydrogenase FAD-binding subunit